MKLEDLEEEVSKVEYEDPRKKATRLNFKPNYANTGFYESRATYTTPYIYTTTASTSYTPTRSSSSLNDWSF